MKTVYYRLFNTFCHQTLYSYQLFGYNSYNCYYDSNIFYLALNYIVTKASHWQRLFQVYIRVSHSLEEDTALADFDPPFTDPLIDDIFIEANVAAVLFDAQTVNSEMYTVAGDFGVAALTVSINVRCAQNYFGSACEMLCDSSGDNCATGK